MKLIVFLSLLLLGFAQFTLAQVAVQPERLNSMSNVFVITGEGGMTLGITDYTTKKFNGTGKASLEYYLPNPGNGNFGFRGFVQTGFISGKVPPLNSGNPTNEFSTKIDMYGGGAIYTLSLGDAIYPWIALGVSNLWFYPKDANGNNLPNNANGVYSSHMLAYNGDVGLRFQIGQKISFNLTGGMIIGTKDWLDDVQSGPSNDLLYTATAGLSYYFNRETDSDGDGVSNSRDMCPDTPPGVKVDENGCPLDSDGDGIADYLDQCPNTPRGVKVDAHGCPLDSDGDGVPDYLDKCSNTPSGVKVDAAGCPLDSDGDGVPDYLDKCPNTPSGAKVDANGCPLDSDGDGVPDYLDKCPNTPKGVEVDADGCPIKKETVIIQTPKDTVFVKQPAEITSIVLNGDANFEFNKAKLLSNAYPVLDSLVSTMKVHPKYKWEIGGYTDKVGSASSNKKLSQRRAQAVVDYLVSQGVSRNNLKIVGYGKENPIATNETLEGRSMNRRVEIKLLSNGK